MLLHKGNVFLLENRSGCQVRNALGSLWGDGSFIDFSSLKALLRFQAFPTLPRAQQAGG